MTESIPIKKDKPEPRGAGQVIARGKNTRTPDERALFG
jgi:hypothetical protein